MSEKDNTPDPDEDRSDQGGSPQQQDPSVDPQDTNNSDQDCVIVGESMAQLTVTAADTQPMETGTSANPVAPSATTSGDSAGQTPVKQEPDAARVPLHYMEFRTTQAEMDLISQASVLKKGQCTGGTLTSSVSPLVQVETSDGTLIADLKTEMVKLQRLDKKEPSPQHIFVCDYGLLYCGDMVAQRISDADAKSAKKTKHELGINPPRYRDGYKRPEPKGHFKLHSKAEPKVPAEVTRSDKFLCKFKLCSGEYCHELMTDSSRAWLHMGLHYGMQFKCPCCNHWEPQVSFLVAHLDHKHRSGQVDQRYLFTEYPPLPDDDLHKPKTGPGSGLKSRKGKIFKDPKKAPKKVRRFDSNRKPFWEESERTDGIRYYQNTTDTTSQLYFKIRLTNHRSPLWFHMAWFWLVPLHVACLNDKIPSGHWSRMRNYMREWLYVESGAISNTMDQGFTRQPCPKLVERKCPTQGCICSLDPIFDEEDDTERRAAYIHITETKYYTYADHYRRWGGRDLGDSSKTQSDTETNGGGGGPKGPPGPPGPPGGSPPESGHKEPNVTATSADKATDETTPSAGQATDVAAGSVGESQTKQLNLLTKTPSATDIYQPSEYPDLPPPRLERKDGAATPLQTDPKPVTPVGGRTRSKVASGSKPETSSKGVGSSKRKTRKPSKKQLPVPTPEVVTPPEAPTEASQASSEAEKEEVIDLTDLPPSPVKDWEARVEEEEQAAASAASEPARDPNLEDGEIVDEEPKETSEELEQGKATQKDWSGFKVPKVPESTPATDKVTQDSSTSVTPPSDPTGTRDVVKRTVTQEGQDRSGRDKSKGKGRGKRPASQSPASSVERPDPKFKAVTKEDSEGYQIQRQSSRQYNRDLRERADGTYGQPKSPEPEASGSQPECLYAKPAASNVGLKRYPSVPKEAHFETARGFESFGVRYYCRTVGAWRASVYSDLSQSVYVNIDRLLYLELRRLILYTTPVFHAIMLYACKRQKTAVWKKQNPKHKTWFKLVYYAMHARGMKPPVPDCKSIDKIQIRQFEVHHEAFMTLAHNLYSKKCDVLRYIKRGLRAKPALKRQFVKNFTGEDSLWDHGNKEPAFLYTSGYSTRHPQRGPTPSTSSSSIGSTADRAGNSAHGSSEQASGSTEGSNVGQATQAVATKTRKVERSGGESQAVTTSTSAARTPPRKGSENRSAPPSSDGRDARSGRKRTRSRSNRRGKKEDMSGLKVTIEKTPPGSGAAKTPAPSPQQAPVTMPKATSSEKLDSSITFGECPEHQAKALCM